jgi:hypothetical protein
MHEVFSPFYQTPRAFAGTSLSRKTGDTIAFGILFCQSDYYLLVLLSSPKNLTVDGVAVRGKLGT